MSLASEEQPVADKTAPAKALNKWQMRCNGPHVFAPLLGMAYGQKYKADNERWEHIAKGCHSDQCKVVPCS